jgi:hypothetical protein
MLCSARKEPDIVLTKEEQATLRSLKRLANKWPRDLELFSWSGTLCVMKRDGSGRRCLIDTFSAIPNDGGDPDTMRSPADDIDDVNDEPEIERE